MASEQQTLAAVLDGMDRPDTVEPGPSPARFSLTIKKFVLLHLLETAIHVVSSRDVMPVLKNIQFELTGSELRVVATDLERWMISSTPLVSTHTPGVAVFSAHKMLHIVRESDDADIRIEVRKNAAAIRIGPTVWHLRLYAGHDFPAAPVADTLTVLTAVDRARFVRALHTVRYAACKDAERAPLMMINVKAGKMTACDGSRIQQAAIEEIPFDFELPIGAVDDLIKMLKSVDLATIHIADAGNKLVFRFGADTFIINKLVARFPDVERTLLRPALENTQELSLNRDDLIHAVRRVRINADPETSAIALRLAPGRVTVAACDKWGNEATEQIDARWTGTTRSVVVNHAFLFDLLARHDRKDCTFYLGDDTKTKKTPLLLRDPDTGTVGALQQMLGDWMGA